MNLRRNEDEIRRLEKLEVYQFMKSNISNGCSEISFRRTLALGANPNHRFPLGDGYTTALHMAASNNRLMHTRVLLEQGAHIDAVDSRGKTPLYISIGTYLAAELPKFLLDNGAKVTTPPGYLSPLFYALQSPSDTVNKTKLFLRYPHDLNEVSKESGLTMGEYLVANTCPREFIEFMQAFLEVHTPAQMIAMLPTTLAALTEKMKDKVISCNAKSFNDYVASKMSDSNKFKICEMMLNPLHPVGHVFLMSCQGSENKLVDNHLRNVRRIYQATCKITGIKPDQVLLGRAKPVIVAAAPAPDIAKEFEESKKGLSKIHSAFYTKSDTLKKDIAASIATEITISDFVKAPPAEGTVTPPANVYNASVKSKP